MNLSNKYKYYCENYPHIKGRTDIFAKFSPSENNHFYSIAPHDYFWVQTERLNTDRIR